MKQGEVWLLNLDPTMEEIRLGLAKVLSINLD